MLMYLYTAKVLAEPHDYQSLPIKPIAFFQTSYCYPPIIHPTPFINIFIYIPFIIQFKKIQKKLTIQKQFLFFRSWFEGKKCRIIFASFCLLTRDENVTKCQYWMSVIRIHMPRVDLRLMLFLLSISVSSHRHL